MNETETPPSVVRRRGRPPKVKFPVITAPQIKEESSLPSIEDATPPAQKPSDSRRAYIEICDVVQIISPTSPHYGTLFIIGDIKAALVHGFHMIGGGKKEFITVGIDECYHIGISKVRSKEPVSPQWKLDHKIP